MSQIFFSTFCFTLFISASSYAACPPDYPNCKSVKELKSPYKELKVPEEILKSTQKSTQERLLKEEAQRKAVARAWEIEHEKYKEKEKQREARKASIEKIDCEFNKFKSWKDFLDFNGPKKDSLSFKGKVSELTNAELSYRGKVIAGKCKGADYFIAKMRGNGIGKTSPPPTYVFSDGFDSDEYVQRERDEIEDLLDDFGAARVIRFNDHFIIEGDDGITSMLADLIMDADPKFMAYTNKELNFQKWFALEKKFQFKGKDFTSRPRVSNRLYSSERSSALEGAEEIYSDSIYGKILVKGRVAELQIPDGAWITTDIGINPDRDGYWFAEFLDESKKGSFAESELEPLSKAGDEGWLKIKESAKSKLRPAYRLYLKRLKKVQEMVDGGMDLEKAKRPTAFSFESYSFHNPFLFYKDPLGRIQVYRMIFHEIPSLAEPVIYFYSPHESELKVQLCQNLKVKSTIPKYVDSWKIRTLPSGRVFDMRSQREYRYLFWEGFAGFIPTQEKGWVVQSSQIDQFLSEKLPMLGLQDSEIADFKRYWVPALEKAPFYQIEFIPESWMNQICPVTITPEPDVFFRVHMRARPLTEYKAIEAQEFERVPVRRGVTAVEWGGFLD